MPLREGISSVRHAIESAFVNDVRGSSFRHRIHLHDCRARTCSTSCASGSGCQPFLDRSCLFGDVCFLILPPFVLRVLDHLRAQRIHLLESLAFVARQARSLAEQVTHILERIPIAWTQQHNRRRR